MPAKSIVRTSPFFKSGLSIKDRGHAIFKALRRDQAFFPRRGRRPAPMERHADFFVSIPIA
jgi:hypothetical protein